MCRAVKCQKCGKTTWAGCGAHVDQVMAGVPASERCRCDEHVEVKKETKSGGLLSSLFGSK